MCKRQNGYGFCDGHLPRIRRSLLRDARATPCMHDRRRRFFARAWAVKQLSPVVEAEHHRIVVLAAALRAAFHIGANIAAIPEESLITQSVIYLLKVLCQ